MKAEMQPELLYGRWGPRNFWTQPRLVHSVPPKKGKRVARQKHVPPYQMMLPLDRRLLVVLDEMQEVAPPVDHARIIPWAVFDAAFKMQRDMKQAQAAALAFAARQRTDTAEGRSIWADRSQPGPEVTTPLSRRLSDLASRHPDSEFRLVTASGVERVVMTYDDFWPSKPRLLDWDESPDRWFYIGAGLAKLNGHHLPSNRYRANR